MKTREVNVPESQRMRIFRYIGEAIRRDDLGALSAVIDVENFQAVITGLETIAYGDYIRELERLKRAFPDLAEDVEILDVIEGDGKLVVVLAMTVHHRGPLTGWAGDGLEPTGREIRIRQTDIYTFGANGLVVHFRSMFDRLDVTNQLMGLS